MVDIISLLVQILIGNPLTISLVILGVLCVALSIIGEIHPVNIKGMRAIALAGFGLLLILIAIGLAWILTPSVQASPIGQQPSIPTVSIGNQPNVSPTQIIDTPSNKLPVPSTELSSQTLTLVSIEKITIPGNSPEGKRFSASESGIYTLKYVDGAYSTYPVNQHKKWQTSIRIYKNGPIWNQNNLGNVYDELAAFGEVGSRNEALLNAKGSSLEIELSQNDYIFLVAVDSKNYYSDNPGEVIVEIFISK